MNVATRHATSESRQVSLESAMRLIMQMAWGEHNRFVQHQPLLMKQARSAGAKQKRKGPRYQKHIDLGDYVTGPGVGGCAWSELLKYVRSVERLPDSSSAKDRVFRDASICTMRVDSICRSGDLSEFDPRCQDYLRCFDVNGAEVLEGPLCQRLLVALLSDVKGNSGHIEVRFRNPKDPRKRPETAAGTTVWWSDWVEVWPLRLELLVDESVPHLSDTGSVQELCTVYRLKRMTDVMDARDRLTGKGAPPTGTWYVNTAKKYDNKFTGSASPLSVQRISNIAKIWLHKAGFRTALDSGSQRDDTSEVLAGHVLRGHSASLAFELSRERECVWDGSLGVDRARHTLASFQRSYSRGVAARLRNVYINHANRSVLRFEETSRL